MAFGIKVSFKSEFGDTVEYQWASTPTHSEINEFVEKQKFFRHSYPISIMIGFIRDSSLGLTKIENDNVVVEKI